MRPRPAASVKNTALLARSDLEEGGDCLDRRSILLAGHGSVLGREELELA